METYSPHAGTTAVLYWVNDGRLSVLSPGHVTHDLRAKWVVIVISRASLAILHGHPSAGFCWPWDTK